MKKNSIYIKLKITFIKIIKDFSAKNVLKKIYKIADDFHLIYIFKRMFVFFVINWVITRRISLIDPDLWWAFGHGTFTYCRGIDVLFTVPPDNTLEYINAWADAWFALQIKYIKSACTDVFEFWENGLYVDCNKQQIAKVVARGLRVIAMSVVYLDGKAWYTLWTKILQPITPWSFLIKIELKNGINYKNFIRYGLWYCVLMKRQKVSNVHRMQTGFAALSWILKFIFVNIRSSRRNGPNT